MANIQNQSWKMSRRTMLKGMGVLMGLPMLEAMAPLRASTSKAPIRMGVLYMANGVNHHTWTPKETGSSFELTEALQPLSNVKNDLLVLTELMNAGSIGGDGHYVKTAAFLTGTTITKTTGSDLRSGGVSMDQIAAQRIGNMTPLPSLELGIEPITTGVDTNVGYTRLYGSHISWSTPTTPVAKEINPRLAFDRIFRPGSPEQRKVSAAQNKSILDLVHEDAKRLQNKLSQADKLKLSEYLDSVRAVEKRIEFDATRRKLETLEDPIARKAIEDLSNRIDNYYLDPTELSKRRVDHTEHVRLMLDIMVLSFWTDSTRISTFMFGNAVSGKNFSFLDGVKGGHHQISHHENNVDRLEEYKRINIWHVQQYAYMLEKMKSIKEGDGTLLDNSMILFGSGMRNGNEHDPKNLPILLAGKGGGTIATGRHMVAERKTPLCNLYRSMLRRMGTPVNELADSTGELKLEA